MMVLLASVRRTSRPPIVARGQSMRSKARNARTTGSPELTERKPFHALGHDGRGEIELVGRLENRLAQTFANVDDRRNTERDEKRDDQHRHRTAQEGLGGEKPPVSGSCDRLSQPLYGIGMRRCARAVGARHLLASASDVPVTLDSARMCRISTRITADLNPIRLICREFCESMRENYFLRREDCSADLLRVQESDYGTVIS